jgi:Zn-finger nucleic acid-binding protein
MLCPVCDERLREVERFGVTVDICPGCKGVWLDRGELERLAGMEKQEDDRSRGEERSERHCDSERDHKPSAQQVHRKPRRSFLSDLMEGFGD